MDWKTFTVEFIGTISWPMVALAILYFFKKEILVLIPKISKVKYKDAEIELNNDIQKLTTTTDPLEKKELISKVTKPNKDSPMSPEDAAQLLANDIISKLPQNFTINEINSVFEGLFSNKNDLNNSGLQNFKSVVIAKIRSNKTLLETNNNGLLEFNKL